MSLPPHWPQGWQAAAAARLELPEQGAGWDPRPVLPLAENAPYDVDVVVVGGGPAGLSAALRVRWIKSFHAVPCSVAVFESGRLGGLSTWRTSALTGPAWRYLGDELPRTRLWPDLLAHQVPILPERVVRVERHGAGFRVMGESTALRCRSLILAAGMRALHNEPWFLHRGLFLTYMGYGYFSRILERAAEVAKGRGLVVFGNARSSHIAPVVAAHAEALGGVTWVVDGALPDAPLPGDMVQGRLREVLGTGDRTAGFSSPGLLRDRRRPDYEGEAVDGVTGVRIETPDGALRELSCGAVLLDYNAYELLPSVPWDGIGLARTPGGTLAVDARLHTSVPGVFAAGDLAGDRYKSVAIAIGDGVNAGFAAVRHVFAGKFGSQPSLYAYAASDRPLGPGESDLPALSDDLLPLLLSPSPKALLRHPAAAARVHFDGATPLHAIPLPPGTDRDDLHELVHLMLERKLGTVHRPFREPVP